jgi:hypothetical protein
MGLGAGDGESLPPCPRSRSSARAAPAVPRAPYMRPFPPCACVAAAPTHSFSPCCRACRRRRPQWRWPRRQPRWQAPQRPQQRPRPQPATPGPAARAPPHPSTCTRTTAPPAPAYLWSQCQRESVRHTYMCICIHTHTHTARTFAHKRLPPPLHPMPQPRPAACTQRRPSAPSAQACLPVRACVCVCRA